MATVTTAGLEYIAKFFNSSGASFESTDIINKIRIGSGITAEAITDTDLITKYTDLGFQEVTASTIEFLNTTAHPRTLHLQKVFTNGATVDREVWECGAFTSGGVCVARHVFQPYELENNNIVPVGQTITIDIYIQMDGSDAATYTRNGNCDYTFNTPIVISASVGTGGIDPSNYTCERGKICFNGKVLPNASPPVVTISRGGKTWNITCYSEDITAIEAILAHQGLVNVGVSVTGYQYATSLQRYGTLKIWNKTTLTHTSYNNCLIAGPVNIEPFGVGWWFNLKIVQSYYGDL